MYIQGNHGGMEMSYKLIVCPEIYKALEEYGCDMTNVIENPPIKDVEFCNNNPTNHMTPLNI